MSRLYIGGKYVSADVFQARFSQPVYMPLIAEALTTVSDRSRVPYEVPLLCHVPRLAGTSFRSDFTRVGYKNPISGLGLTNVLVYHINESSTRSSIDKGYLGLLASVFPCANTLSSAVLSISLVTSTSDEHTSFPKWSLEKLQEH